MQQQEKEISNMKSQLQVQYAELLEQEKERIRVSTVLELGREVNNT